MSDRNGHGRGPARRLTASGSSYSVWQGQLEGGIIKGTTSNVEGLKRDFVLLKKAP